MRKLAIAVFAAGMVAASGAYAEFGYYVSDELKALEAMQPRGTPFQNAAKAEYQALAAEELKESDHQHADRWLRKGKAAGSGEDILPESPSTWLIPNRARAEIEDAYAKLMAARSNPGLGQNPAAAARAHAMFDCWLEEEHEDYWHRAPGLEMPGPIFAGGGYYEPAEVKRCKDGFWAAYNEWLGAEQAFIIFFAFDKSNLDAAAMRVVGDVVGAANRAPQARVSIFGHTDRAGSVEYNLGLSKRRADAVASALAARGVARTRMTASGFGESRPRVPTADGVPEAQNRRAEITVK